MEIFLKEQTAAFLISFGWGIFLCAGFRFAEWIFDWIAGRKIVRFLLDFSWFLLAGISTFILFLVVSQGEVRGYLYWGIALGWILFRQLADLFPGKRRRLRPRSRFVPTAFFGSAKYSGGMGSIPRKKYAFFQKK